MKTIIKISLIAIAIMMFQSCNMSRYYSTMRINNADDVSNFESKKVDSNNSVSQNYNSPQMDGSNEPCKNTGDEISMEPIKINASNHADPESIITKSPAINNVLKKTSPVTETKSEISSVTKNNHTKKTASNNKTKTKHTIWRFFGINLLLSLLYFGIALGISLLFAPQWLVIMFVCFGFFHLIVGVFGALLMIIFKD